MVRRDLRMRDGNWDRRHFYPTKNVVAAAVSGGRYYDSADGDIGSYNALVL